MNNLIFSDANRRPDLFVWNGAIATEWLQNWLQRHHWQVPEDLFVFWQKTGGGDIYESETILGPLGDNVLGDNLGEVNEHLRAQGMADRYVVFYRGLGGLAAVRLTDGQYVQLAEESFAELSEYASFEEWYRRLREEYAERYGLSVYAYPQWSVSEAVAV